MRSIAWFASLIAVTTLLLVSVVAGVGSATSSSYAVTVSVELITGQQTPAGINLTLENAATGQSCQQATAIGGQAYFTSSSCPSLGEGWWHVNLPPQMVTITGSNAYYVTPPNALGASVFVGKSNGVPVAVTLSNVNLNASTSTLKGSITGVAPGALYHVSLIDPRFPGYSIRSVTTVASQVHSTSVPAQTASLPTHQAAALPGSTVSVKIDIFPQSANCAISFGGTTYANGATFTGGTGNYSITAEACSGAAFTNWSATAGPIVNSLASTTSIDVTASGYLNASYTTALASFTLTNVPHGTWTLYTYGYSNGSTTYDRYSYISTSLTPDTKSVFYQNVTLSDNFVSGHYLPNTLTFNAPSNITIWDSNTSQAYTTYQPASGSTFFQTGVYPGLSTPTNTTFLVFLAPQGYNSTWHEFKVSDGSGKFGSVNYPNFMPPIHQENSTYTNTSITLGLTNSSWRYAFSANVSSQASWTNDGTFAQLPNASVGNLWAQLGFDFNAGRPSVNSAAFTKFTQWLSATGPIYPVQAMGLGMNGTVFQTGTNVTLAPAFPGIENYSSALGLHYNSWSNYSLGKTLPANSSSYHLSVGFNYPSVGEYANYTVHLPTGFVLKNGTAAPAGTSIVPSGPVGPGGHLWTSFTILPSPYSRTSGVANFTIYKVGNVSAIVNVTSSNFAFSSKNILNSTLDNYTVEVGSNTNDSYTATHSLVPATMNVTSFVWNFTSSPSASCVNSNGFTNLTAQCVYSNVSTVHHIFSTGGVYHGTLTLRTSGGVSNTTRFTTYVDNSPPSAHISVNNTHVTALNATLGYLYVNWSTLLHFNATGSVDEIVAGGGNGTSNLGNISVANWTIQAGSTHHWVNYTVGGGAKVFNNVSYQFLGAGTYVKHNLTVDGTQLSLTGWEYSVTLTLWDAGGKRANATLYLLVNDTEKPVAVATVQNAQGKNITGGLVEQQNHTAEVQLLDNYSYDPHNGSLAQYSWSVQNSKGEHISACNVNKTGRCYWNSTSNGKWFLWLAPSTGAYNFTLNVTDLAGNKANTTYPVTVAQNLTFRPIITVSNLTASSTTMTDGSSYTISVTVNNTAFAKATAYNVTANFYVSGANGNGNQSIGSSPGQVKWFGYVGSVVNSSSSYTGILPAEKANQTWKAQITYTPPSGFTGTKEIWVNVTASNEFSGEYSSHANIASISVTINPNPLTQDLEYVAIAVAAVVIIVVAVLFYRRRIAGPSSGSGKKDKKSEKGSKDDKSKEKEEKPEDDEKEED